MLLKIEEDIQACSIFLREKKENEYKKPTVLTPASPLWDHFNNNNISTNSTNNNNNRSSYHLIFHYILCI
jgi:hypothetical protein